MSNWQTWLTHNYKTLSTWSKRWHPTEHGELISFMTLYLEKNWSQFSTIPDGIERIKFLQAWMKNNVKWKNSDFNKSIRVNNFSDEFTIADIETNDFLDIKSEDLPENIKDWIIDLNRRFGEIDVDRIVMIRSVYLKLKPHEKALYDMYFTQMLSMRSVATKLNLPLSAVYGMILDLKKKLIEQCQK
jgi:hypothetical protein